jgi:hypothetical protein
MFEWIFSWSNLLLINSLLSIIVSLILLCINNFKANTLIYQKIFNKKFSMKLEIINIIVFLIIVLLLFIFSQNSLKEKELFEFLIIYSIATVGILLILIIIFFIITLYFLYLSIPLGIGIVVIFVLQGRKIENDKKDFMIEINLAIIFLLFTCIIIIFANNKILNIFNVFFEFIIVATPFTLFTL